MSCFAKVTIELNNIKHLSKSMEKLKEKAHIKDYVQIDEDFKITANTGRKLDLKHNQQDNSYQLQGDTDDIRAIEDKIKRWYAFASVMDNIPLDFEAVEIKEQNEEIYIYLKA